MDLLSFAISARHVAITKNVLRVLFRVGGMQLGGPFPPLYQSLTLAALFLVLPTTDEPLKTKAGSL